MADGVPAREADHCSARLVLSLSLSALGVVNLVRRAAWRRVTLAFFSSRARAYLLINFSSPFSAAKLFRNLTCAPAGGGDSHRLPGLLLIFSSKEVSFHRRRYVRKGQVSAWFLPMDAIQ